MAFLRGRVALGEGVGLLTVDVGYFTYVQECM